MTTAFQTPPDTGPNYLRQPRVTRRLRSSARSNGDQSNPFNQLSSSESLQRYLESIQSGGAMGAFPPQTPPPPAFWSQEQEMPRTSMPLMPSMPQYPNWTSNQPGDNGEQRTDPFAPPSRVPLAPTAAPGAVPGQQLNLYAHDRLNDSPRGLNAGLVEPSPPDSLSWGPNGTILSDWAHAAHNGVSLFDQNSLTGEGGVLNTDFGQRMVLNQGRIHLPSPSHSIRSSGSKRDVSPIPSDTEKPWACERCPARFSRKRDTERHMRSVHTGEAPYVCKGCKEGFVRSDARGRHWKLDPACQALHQEVEGLETSKSRSRMSK